MNGLAAPLDLNGEGPPEGLVRGAACGLFFVLGKKRSEELSLFEDSDPPPKLPEPSELEPKEPRESDEPSDPEPNEPREPNDPKESMEPKDSEENSDPREGPKELDPESERVERGPEPEEPIWNISLGFICFLCELSVDKADEADGL